MAPYENIVGLEGVYLEDSFVLAVSVKPKEVDFDVDLVLAETHPQYSSPRKGERYCYRRGRIRFLGTRQVSWRMGSVQAAYDATGEVDYGGFDRFEVESDRYTVSGDFGTLQIEAERCEVTLEG